MRQKLLQNVCIALLVWLLPVSVFAISLDDAAQQAAKQNDAKVLSARTVQQGDSQTHEIKLLTKEGVVKTVSVPDNSNSNSKKKKR